jgi:membrane-bound lytic murein transglycosylase D
MPDSSNSSNRGVRPLRVHLPDGRTERFTEAFHVGRDHECEVQVEDVHVSRRHALVTPEDGIWTIRDLQSRNGIFVDGRRRSTADIGDQLAVVLGEDGPELHFEIEQPAPARAAGGASEEIAVTAERYFGSGADDGEDVGSRTIMIRQAFQQIQQQQKRRHRWVVSAVALVGAFAAAYAFYAYNRISAQEALAREMFYAMKALDVDIARVEQRMAASGDTQASTEMAKYMEQRRQMENNYEQFAANIYDRRLSEKDRLILRVTRKLGECELAAPSDYIREVNRYISQWQSTRRFTTALKLAQDLGYTRRIAQEFAAQDLPPQFFYLAMQESNFDPLRSGPKTRWGIAKGMWQFIPETGLRYGLRIGPLAREGRQDPGDDRFDWQKSTTAAARYVKDIYTTDAQASGLLVMASYNWGENRVIDLVRTLPNNPKERNFWQLLERYRRRIPDQTYDYVFNIVAAAVIGENPRLFGFQVDNPLAFLEQLPQSN